MSETGLKHIMSDRFNLLLKKTFVAITGASRGLGRSMALQFSVKLPPKSVIVLMARTKEDLERVKSEVLSVAPDINVLVRQYDQGSVEIRDYFKGMFDELLLDNNLEDDFEQYMIIHNCASIGDVSKRSLELSDSMSVRNSFDTNITGMVLLNTSFFQTFSDSSKSRVVVNMTSAAILAPFPSFHQYCTGKAARDMFMRVLAVEEPSLRILTFSPGVADTAYMREMETFCMDASVVAMLKNWRADGTMTSPDVPISKLVQLLEENTFENAVYAESDKVF